MADMKLFRLEKNDVEEIAVRSVAVEKTLQSLIERHLEKFLSVRFLGSEYSTGKTHKGRIDTLGIDENGSPVIIEYKRALNENVINQGLFYLDWLLDHKGEFELLISKRLGHQSASAIDWSAPRLICIASDFTKYDEHAVQQMNRHIELIRYRCYGDSLLLLERIALREAEGRIVRTETRTAEDTSASQTEYRGRNGSILKFFRQLLPERAPAEPWVGSYMQVRTKYSGVHFEWWQRGQKNAKTLDVAVHFESTSGEQNRALCDFLKEQKDTFANHFDQGIVFDREWGDHYSSVFIRRPCLPWSDEIAEWAARNMQELIAVVEPLLQVYFAKREEIEGG